jgi:cell wall-associated NlpC family hydrolase
MTTRADIVAEARTWMGTPWVHAHRAKGHAVDCAGLVIGVARNLGLVPDDFDVPGYGTQPDGRLLKLCQRFMAPVARDDMQPGDVVVVAAKTQQPQHLGIVTPYPGGKLAMIHATSTGQRGVVESRLVFTPVFQFRAAFALPGVE